MTLSGRKAIAAILNKQVVQLVGTDGASHSFYGSSNIIKAISQSYNESVSNGGTSMILSTTNETSESATIPTGIINLKPTNATTTIGTDGSLILTYIFTNSTGGAITINSIGLATKIDAPSYPVDSSILILWDGVASRTVAENEVFTFSVAIKS